MGRRWQTAIGVAVSLALLYWALHDIDLQEVWGHVRSADLALLGLAVVVQTAGFLIRAARWRVFLMPALPGSRFHPRFAATCIGFMANNLLPARLGEFARAYALSRAEPLSVSASFGSLVVERLFDAAVLGSFLVLPFFLPSFQIGPALGDRLFGGVVGVLVVFALLIVGAFVLMWRTDLVARAFHATVGRILPGALSETIENVLRSFAEGLGAIRRPGLIAAGLAWSLAHWGWTAIAYLLGLSAFGITEPGFPGALFLQSVQAFAVAIPSSPGFFGLFEASARFALAPFGVPASRAVSFAIAYHITTFIPVTVIGIVYLGRLGLTWRDVERSERIVEGRG